MNTVNDIVCIWCQRGTRLLGRITSSGMYKCLMTVLYPWNQCNIVLCVNYNWKKNFKCRMNGLYKTIHPASVEEGLAWAEARFSRIEEETVVIQLCGTKSLWWLRKWLWRKNRRQYEGALNSIYFEWRVVKHYEISYIFTHSLSIYLLTSFVSKHCSRYSLQWPVPTTQTLSLSDYRRGLLKTPPSCVFSEGTISYLCKLIWCSLSLLISCEYPGFSWENSSQSYPLMSEESRCCANKSLAFQRSLHYVFKACLPWARNSLCPTVSTLLGSLWFVAPFSSTSFSKWEGVALWEKHVLWQLWVRLSPASD